MFTLVAEPLPDPKNFQMLAGEPEKRAKRRKEGEVEAEYNAVTCVAVYIFLMNFSQKGINKLRQHQESMKEINPDGEFVVSEGFDDGMMSCFQLPMTDERCSAIVVQGSFPEVQ